MFTKELEIAYVLLTEVLSKNEKEALTVDEVATQLHTTPMFIRKIRQKLKNANLVVSLGHKGFIRTDKNIRVSELYLLFSEFPEGTLGKKTMGLLSQWEI